MQEQKSSQDHLAVPRGQQETALASGPWRVQTIKAGKGRAVVRYWISGPRRQRAGHFVSVAAAQTECDARNALAGTPA